MSELVTDYLDGALPLRVRLHARLHLFLCRACVRYYDQMRKTVRLLAGVRAAPLDAGTERRLLDAVAHRDDMHRHEP